MELCSDNPLSQKGLQKVGSVMKEINAARLKCIFLWEKLAVYQLRQFEISHPRNVQ